MSGETRNGRCARCKERRKEAKVFDIVVAQAMGSSERISQTNPHLVTLRRKSMKMREKATA